MFCTPKGRQFSTEFENEAISTLHKDRVLYNMNWIRKNDKFVAKFQIKKHDNSNEIGVEITDSNFGNLKKTIINIIKTLK